MKKFIRRFYRKQGGFTLIELLVVIAILGILAAIIVPNVASYLGSADISAANTEAHMVQNAVYSYMADNKGTVPGTTDDCAEFVSGTLKGVYNINDTTGVITGDTYGTTTFTWVNGEWVK